MNFISWAFVALFLIVVAARLTIGRRKIEAPFVALLTVSSLVFYGWHVPWYLSLLLFSAGVDYLAALALGRVGAADGDPSLLRRRRLILLVSLATNLGLLGFFKYANFGLDSAEQVVALFGLELSLPRLDIVLPMGISFYTFQSMSYTIDVYRGVLAPLRGFVPFLLYISFFPQLVAGPIVRATEFLPQIGRVRRLHLPVFAEGMYMMIVGAFLKMVCADNLGKYVDAHWATGYSHEASAGMVIVLTLLFSGQIFCDFAGYSSIARGLALILGYRLPVNFNAPYIAASFKNFWERWHITLSSWLRDYLYVPLGGNRISRRRTYVNLMLVMLLGGLWHGAAVTYIVWGALHGAGLAVERLLGLHRNDNGRRPWGIRAAWFLVVQVVVLVTWVVFRSTHIAGAWQFLANVAPLDFHGVPPSLTWAMLFLVPVVIHHLWYHAEERAWVAPMGPYSKGVVAGLLVLGIVMGYGGTGDFIYFQF